METILTSYLLDNTGVHLSIGKLYGILTICKKCGRYASGECGKGKDGISVCRHGCSVYEENDVVYFGLQLKDSFKSKKVFRFDLPLVMSCGQFHILQSYDRQLESLYEIRQKALCFSQEYDRCVDEIRTSLPDPKGEQWERDRIATTISGLAIERVVRALNSLKTARQSLMPLLTLPRFKDLLPFISNGMRNNSLFAPDSRCLRCRRCECNKGNYCDNMEKEFNQCSNGVIYINAFARTYCGVHVMELERKIIHKMKKTKVNLGLIFSMQKLRELIVFINKPEFEINTARRFLHDSGQYLAAIQNLLPYENNNQCQSSIIKVSSLISINAMTLALQCLKKQLTNNYRKSERRHEFSPYQLFDKYRYCFGESYGQIRLIKIDGGDFYEQVNAYHGFEFAVLNLLNNAIKYLPSDDRYNAVDIKFHHDKRGVEILIESMGLKVDDNDLPKLGMRWFRGRNAIESNVPGEGLGLHATVTCMRRSGFSITFRSYGKIVQINDLEYRTFSARIRIPKQYVIDEISEKQTTRM